MNKRSPIVLMYSRLRLSEPQTVSLADFLLTYEVHESEVKQRRLFKKRGGKK